jgi:hypothetical protein
LFLRVAAELVWTAVGRSVLPNVSEINASIVGTLFSPTPIAVGILK